ncbi:MAG: DUF927 domain-containing protein [Gammaproteobacteria bacterium]|nr:MAG: DUF927 domain-containing protein [Gammaproteobacteria bacterium]
MAQYRKTNIRCNVSDIERQFSEVLAREVGFIAEPVVVADGRQHRFDVEKRGDKKGFYQLFADGIPNALYGRWDEHGPGQWLRWQPEGTPVEDTPEERAARRREIEANKKKREQERQKEQAEAAAKASEIWEQAKPCSSHPYLERKGVGAYGVRVSGDDLLIPIKINKRLTSLQFIKPDGSKRFLSGGVIKGGYHVIPGSMERVYIVEGYATGASVHEAIGCTVVVALNAGNLESVAKNIRAKAKDVEIVVAGDHDTSGTGREKGEKAAKAVGAAFIMPPEVGTDWNDYHREHGLKATKAALGGTPGNDGGGEPVNDEPQEPETQPTGTATESPYPESPRFPEAPSGFWFDDSGVYQGKRPDYETYKSMIHEAAEAGDEEQVAKLESELLKKEQAVREKRLTWRPCWIEAMSRDTNGQSWGRLVAWIDDDGQERREAIPAELFYGQGADLAKYLADRGLPIMPGKEKALLKYLASFRVADRLRAATNTGWHGSSFILPHITINQPQGERIIYQPDERRLDTCFSQSGSLEAWQDIVKGCGTHVRFAIAAALAAPVMQLAGVQSGGFHFHGVTSRGKTSLLQTAASAWGNGADPAIQGGSDAYIQRWNATRNGLEGMAASFNDLPLVIDEIGEGDSRDFGRIIYSVMAGTGKSRATRTGAIAKRRAWRVLVLSAGEIAVSAFVEHAAGGQLVRLVDISADQIFPDGDAVDSIKRACASNYGWAGPAFLESGDLLEGWRDFKADQIGYALTPEAKRVRERFRLVAHAGELAIKRGILPWHEGEVLEACEELFAIWQTEVATTDGERGIQNVRNFILTQPARFEKPGQEDEIHNRAGVVRDGYYHFFLKSFEEACGGIAPDVVRRALADAGLLRVGGRKRLTSTITFQGRKVRVVSVSKDIIGDTQDIEEQSIEEIEASGGDIPF